MSGFAPIIHGGGISSRGVAAVEAGGINLGVTPLFVFFFDEEDDNQPVYDTFYIIPHATDSLYCRPLDSFPSTSVIVVLEHSTTVSG